MVSTTELGRTSGSPGRQRESALRIPSPKSSTNFGKSIGILEVSPSNREVTNGGQGLLLRLQCLLFCGVGIGLSVIIK